MSQTGSSIQWRLSYGITTSAGGMKDMSMKWVSIHSNASMAGFISIWIMSGSAVSFSSNVGSLGFCRTVALLCRNCMPSMPGLTGRNDGFQSGSILSLLISTTMWSPSLPGTLVPIGMVKEACWNVQWMCSPNRRISSLYPTLSRTSSLVMCSCVTIAVRNGCPLCTASSNIVIKLATCVSVGSCTSKMCAATSCSSAIGVGWTTKKKTGLLGAITSCHVWVIKRSHCMKSSCKWTFRQYPHLSRFKPGLRYHVCTLEVRSSPSALADACWSLADACWSLGLACVLAR